MIEHLNPALILILGGLLIPLLPTRLRNPFMLLLPILGLLQLITLPQGEFGQLEFASYSLTTLRLDGLSLIFGIIFHIAAAIGIIYAWHQRDTLQQISALVYGGAAIGAVLAGDLLTLFVYWELAAIASVFLIWARRSERSYRAGLRYLIIQVSSGVLLLMGAAIYAQSTGNLDFNHIGLDTAGGWIIFIAFGIKCAFPLLHNWLQDAYPEATVTGTVVLSVFTTKLAVYALARGYAGESILIWIGAIMTAFPIFFAVIENDMRRVLSYSLNNQLGFMVVGIGVGTELALNGTAAHAFVHILYKALLFMSMGAVLFRVGHVRASDLGGLAKSMPWTAGFCLIGSASISAFPLLSGFVAKSLILAAVAEQGYWVTWLVLLFASAGVLDHSGVKIPFFTFFHHDGGHRVKEAPTNMLIAMSIAAFFCIAIGIYPAALYALLPWQNGFDPYSASHVIAQLQLLLFALLAFVVLMKNGVYPEELRATNIDSDWAYRCGIPRLLNWGADRLSPPLQRINRFYRKGIKNGLGQLAELHGPNTDFARIAPSGLSALIAVALFGVVLILNFFY